MMGMFALNRIIIICLICCINCTRKDEFYTYQFEKILNKGEKIEITSLESISSCTLELEWKSDIKNKSEFVVEWSWDENKKSDISNKMKYTIMNLNASKTYEVKVSMELEAGKRETSKPQNMKTRDLEPLDDLKPIDVSEDQIHISWKVPECTVNYYKIEWNGTTLWKEDRTVSGNDVSVKTTYILSHLTPYSSYTICVQKEEAGGSECISETTAQAEPSPPLSLSAIAVENSSINVSWSEPFDVNGIIKHYEVSWQLSTENYNYTNATTIKFHYTIINLLGCASYIIEVRAWTDAGEGKPDTIFENTAIGAPPQVEYLKFVPKTAKSGILQWKRPMTNCTITSYQINGTGVMLWGNDKKIQVNETEVEGDRDYHDAEDLIPMSNYTFCVTATVDETFSGNVSCIEIKTKEDVPGAPQSLEVIEDFSARNKIIIRWKDPNELNGELRKFKVSWKSKVTNSIEIEYKNNNGFHWHTMEDLSFNTQYDIEVAAATKIGYGVASKTIWRTDVNTLGIVLGVMVPLCILLILGGLAYVFRDRINFKGNPLTKTLVN